jgi:signal peptidase II
VGPLVDHAEPAIASTAASSVRAYRSVAAWSVLLLVLCFGLAHDLGSKHWTFETVAQSPVRDPGRKPIPAHQGVEALPLGLLEFQLVVNHGAVFGLGENKRFFFIAFTVAALSAALLVFARFTAAHHRLAHVAIGLVIAGGLGNLHDRIVHGVVRDFLHMMPNYQLPFGWIWPGGSPELFPWVFNCADVMLLLGMGLLMLHMNRIEKWRRGQSAQTSAVGAESCS